MSPLFLALYIAESGLNVVSWSQYFCKHNFFNRRHSLWFILQFLSNYLDLWNPSSTLHHQNPQFWSSVEFLPTNFLIGLSFIDSIEYKLPSIPLPCTSQSSDIPPLLNFTALVSAMLFSELMEQALWDKVYFSLLYSMPFWITQLNYVYPVV